MNTIQKINQILDKIQQYKTTVDKNITKVDNRFALTANEIIENKIPLNMLGCTGLAKLFSYYANEIDLDCEVVFTANENDLKNNSSQINGHQLISVKLENGKDVVFDPREPELKEIDLTNFSHAGTPHIFVAKQSGKDIEQVNSVEKIEKIYLDGYKSLTMLKGIDKLKNHNNQKITIQNNER